MTKYKHKELAIMASIIGFTSFLIFIYGIHTTKNATRLPYPWLFLLITSQLLSLTYGILNNMPEAYIPTSLVTSGLLYVLYIKIQYSEDVRVEEELIKKKILHD
jgi:hypothetical protein